MGNVCCECKRDQHGKGDTKQIGQKRELAAKIRTDT